MKFDFKRELGRLGWIAFAVLCAATYSVSMKHKSLKQRSNGLISKRVPASQPFPRHRQTRDTGEILDNYRDYLKFVLSIGRQVDPARASELNQQFTELEKESPEHAAKFLKGLRVELEQRVEIMGVGPSRVSSSHPALQAWVRKYLPTWRREVNEARFRAHTDKLIARRQS